MNQERRLVQHPAEAEVGDYATIESLYRAGGKFYTMPGEEREAGCLVNRAMCDTPTATWELFCASDPGYRRVE